MKGRARWGWCGASLALVLGCGDEGVATDDGGSETGGSASTLPTSVTGDAGTFTGEDTTVDGSSGAQEGSTGATESGSTGDPCDCDPGTCPPQCFDPLEPEVGHVEIEPVDYTLHAGAQFQSYTASAARLWYGFQPADETPEDKPLMVFFNGGPGAASEVVFSFNTSQRSFDEEHNGGGAIGASPASWTSIANLLYIDARITGFSYNLMDDPSDAGARMAEFSTRNFNTPLDAADFVRVLLRFLAAHPQIRANEVILVGESYGGVRATAMLDLLLDYEAHAGSSSAYEDVALVDEIQAHFDAVFPAMAGQSFPPEKIAEQFSRQILIQPLLLGSRQLDTTGDLHDLAGSVIFQIANDVGQTFVPCSAQGGGCDPFANAIDFVENVAGRDRFAYPYPYDWLFGRIDSLGPKFSTVALTTEFFGVDIGGVSSLYAAERTQAYRAPGMAASPLVGADLDAFSVVAHRPEVLSPGWSLVGGGPVAIDGDYPQTFGDLESWDTYYMPSNYVVLDSFYGSIAYNYGIDPYDDANALAFMRNAAHVDTFITSAAYDLVIWSPAIPATLEQFPAYVSEVTHDETGPIGADRPGQILVEYADGAFGLGAGVSRTIRFPLYDDASHTVPLNQPVELLSDVADWLGS